MAATLVKAGYCLVDSASSFSADSVNTDLFTHVFCGFADIDPHTKKVTISSSKESQVSTFSATIKQKAPDVKTLLSIGGDGAPPERFASIAGLSTGRKAFIDSSISLARKYNFDGLDLQWLYPTKKLEMNNLGSLLNEWHDSVVTESQQQSKPQLLLIATVFYSPHLSPTLIYPVDAMSSSLDWINVLAYDFYTPASSPEQSGPATAFVNKKTASLCGSFGIQEWTKESFPSKKIVMGLPFYGWAWLLLNAAKHEPFAPTDGPSTGQDGVLSDGRVGYGDLVKLIKKFSATPVFDPSGIFSYAYYGTNWIAYDDGKSISAKVSKAKSLNLLGYFAWHIGGDDEDFTLANTASQQWDA